MIYKLVTVNHGILVLSEREILLDLLFDVN